MKGMITKVFLVIAVLIICLGLWVLVLGKGGVADMTWSGIAGAVNDTSKEIFGDGTTLMPDDWKGGTNLDDAQGGLDEGNAE